MATTMLLVAVTLILAFRDGYCCMCEPRHPQQHFCGSDFVVQAGVLDKDLVYDNDNHIANHFIVNVKKVYKASEAYENVTQFFISSPAITHNQCGIADLVIGQDYLITGFIANGELQTTTCDWVKPHSELTAAQKNGLSSKYELGCQKCNIAACRDGQCGGNSQPAGSTCVWDFFDRLADCYIQHGICRHNGRECSWASTNVFQECEENILFGGSLTHDGPIIW